MHALVTEDDPGVKVLRGLVLDLGLPEGLKLGLTLVLDPHGERATDAVIDRAAPMCPFKKHVAVS